MTKRHNPASDGGHGLLSLKIPALYTFAIAILVGVASFLVVRGIYTTAPNLAVQRDTPRNENSEYLVKRLTNSKFIRPLLSAKPVNEYAAYSRIKQSVSEVIQLYKGLGVLSSAAMYMRDFDKSNWTAVNQNEKFMPGSILKIPVLMTILKYEEEHRGSLDSTMPFIYKFQYEYPKQQSIVTQKIQWGKRYSRRELLRYMIEYSDNNATLMLWMIMNKDMFFGIFQELGLPKPDLDGMSIPLSAQECSLFMESLFNATILNVKLSEYAVDLLCKSTFKEGIVKGIPVGKLLIAHKFGESGAKQQKELHETALLYLNEKPYLITIMTRGQTNVDLSRLAVVIQEISRSIYEGLAERPHK
jgi:beta-lactamase class A